MDSIDKINALLFKLGMTGADLERLIGVSNSVYSQWNTKTTKPSKKSLAKVAVALNVDISEIMPDPKKKEKPTTQQGGELSPLRQEAWELLNSLSDEKLEKALVILRTVREM